MSKFYLDEEVIFIPTKEKTRIIKVLPKGQFNLSHDFYIPECSPKKSYTDAAFLKLNPALHPPHKKNQCKGCRWLVDISTDAFCFVSEQRVYRAMMYDYRPSKCVLGTEEEKKLLTNEGEQNEKKPKLFGR